MNKKNSSKDEFKKYIIVLFKKRCIYKIDRTPTNLLDIFEELELN